MAQALSIIGEQGIHGMEYNGLIVSWGNETGRFKSKKLRWSMISAFDFSGRLFEEYMILAWRFGLVERTKYKELDWKHGLNKSAYEVEDEIVRLTREGWEFMERNDRPVLHRWAANVVDNLPTLLISAIAAVAVSWAAYTWGAPVK